MLVVEDDSAINDVICRQLSGLGVSRRADFSGTEANRALDSEDFDLVVTDLMLPGMARRAGDRTRYGTAMLLCLSSLCLREQRQGTKLMSWVLEPTTTSPSHSILMSFPPASKRS